jgi:hypothetical protein
MSKWIRTSKYNPPLDKPVLALITHCPEIGASEIHVCVLDCNDGSWFVANTYEDPRDRLKLSSIRAKITHWMELPGFPGEIEVL